MSAWSLGGLRTGNPYLQLPYACCSLGWSLSTAADSRTHVCIYKVTCSTDIFTETHTQTHSHVNRAVHQQPDTFSLTRARPGSGPVQTTGGFLLLLILAEAGASLTLASTPAPFPDSSNTEMNPGF